MATKTVIVVRPGRYGTRMLQAGDALECSAPDARLYAKLGWAEEKAERVTAKQETGLAPVKRARRRKKTA